MYKIGFFLFFLIACKKTPTSDITSENNNVEFSDTNSKETVPKWAKRIHKARSKISPMEDNLLPKITEQYNIEVTTNSIWAKQCMKYLETFKKVSALTLYPTALIGGIAMHESGGCKMSARDWAGGRGLMQITSKPSKKYLQNTAKILAIPTRDVKYKSNPLHNIVMGMIYLDDSERAFKSRFHGILAYNMGVQGVKRTIHRMGKSTKQPPTILTMKPHLKYNKRMKPRIYVQRVISSIIAFNQAMQEQEIKRLSAGELSTDNIPGWYPNQDGKEYFSF